MQHEEEVRLLRSLIGDLFGDLLVVDIQGTIVYALPSTARRMGVELLTGATVTELLEPDHAAELLHAARDVQRTHERVSVTVRFVDRRGQGAAELPPLPVVVVPCQSRDDCVVLLGQELLGAMLQAAVACRERQKELTCLYQVGQAIEDAITVEELFSSLPDILRRAFLFPDEAHPWVSWRGRSFGEEPLPDTRRIEVDVHVFEEQAGRFVIWSTQSLPFLREEEQMMLEVGRMTRKAIEKYEQGIEHRASLRHLRSLLEAIPDRIVLIDSDYRVLITNDERDSLSLPCYATYHQRSTPCPDCPASRALATGQPAQVKRRTKRCTLLLNAYPVTNDHGEVEGVVEYLKDITQEEQVQEQLLHADKMASLGQLTAGVAHELNNPTQFIRENIRIVREALDDMIPIVERQWRREPELRIARLPFPFFQSQIPVLAQDIETGATRIRDIVSSLKQFARNDDGTLDDAVDIVEAMDTSLRLVHNQIKSVAEVERELEEDLPRVRGNVQKIEQVLVNIILNAAQAIQGQLRHGHPHRKGHIAISARADRPKGLLQLSIRDDGPGIPPGVLKRVFDPFYTTKQEHGGTGLGLSIAYGIVQDHKGSIRVESNVGEGTVFHLTLPILQEGPDHE